MNKSTFLDHAMFKKKQIDREMPDSNSSRSLSRTLSTFDLVMLGIGGIIGMGIFVLSGLVAGLHAGNALPLSFVFPGVACLFAALCYAEFSAMIPLAGSAYTSCYMTLGEIWAWIIGWDLILEYGLAVLSGGNRLVRVSRCAPPFHRVVPFLPPFSTLRGQKEG